ncbi:MAG: hypothetical protein ACK5LK_05520 [Chthoniobacterales bacterium]
MKKILLIIALLLLLAGGVLLWKLAQMRRSQPIANYLSQETVFLVAAEDLPGSSLQWTQTSLSQLFSDKDILKAIEGTKSKFWASDEASQGAGYLVSLQPKQVFASVLDRGDQGVALLGGVHYVGSRSSAEGGLARMREFLAGADAEPVLSKETVDGVELTSQETKRGTLISANERGWIVFSDSREILLEFLSAVKAGSAVDSLAQDPLFMNIAKQLDPACELQAFLRVEPVLERVIAFGDAMGAVADPAQVELLKNAEGLGYSSTFQGKDIEDKFFIKSKNSPADLAIKKVAAPLAREENLFLYETALDTKSPTWQTFLEKVPDEIVGAAAQSGLDFEKLPETVSDGAVWASLGKGAFIPDMEGVLTLADTEQAQKWLEFFLAQGKGDIAKEDRLDSTIYILGAQGSIKFVEPSVAVREGELLAALSPADLDAMLSPQNGESQSLLASPKFASVKSYYDSNPVTFVYLDTPGVVRRAYATVLPALRFGASVLKDVEQYVNVEQLPDEATFADKLGPIVGVQYNRPDGYLFETRGPVTLNHLLLGGSAGGISTFWKD